MLLRLFFCWSSHKVNRFFCLTFFFFFGFRRSEWNWSICLSIQWIFSSLVVCSLTVIFGSYIAKFPFNGVSYQWTYRRFKPDTIKAFAVSFTINYTQQQQMCTFWSTETFVLRFWLKDVHYIISNNNNNQIQQIVILISNYLKCILVNNTIIDIFCNRYKEK